MGEMIDTLREMADDLGQATVDRVLARGGGMRLYVPIEAQLEGSTLWQILGPIPARWLSPRFGPGVIELPCARAISDRRRARDIEAAVANAPETPVNELANRLQISHRRVQQIRAALRAREPQAEPPLLSLARSPSSGA